MPQRARWPCTRASKQAQQALQSHIAGGKRTGRPARGEELAGQAGWSAGRAERPGSRRLMGPIEALPRRLQLLLLPLLLPALLVQAQQVRPGHCPALPFQARRPGLPAWQHRSTLGLLPRSALLPAARVSRQLAGLTRCWCAAPAAAPPPARPARAQRVRGCRQGPPAEQHDLVQPGQPVAHSEEPAPASALPTQVLPLVLGLAARLASHAWLRTAATGQLLLAASPASQGPTAAASQLHIGSPARAELCFAQPAAAAAAGAMHHARLQCVRLVWSWRAERLLDGAAGGQPAAALGRLSSAHAGLQVPAGQARLRHHAPGCALLPYARL